MSMVALAQRERVVERRAFAADLSEVSEDRPKVGAFEGTDNIVEGVVWGSEERVVQLEPYVAVAMGTGIVAFVEVSEGSF